MIVTKNVSDRYINLKFDPRGDFECTNILKNMDLTSQRVPKREPFQARLEKLRIYGVESSQGSSVCRRIFSLGIASGGNTASTGS